MTAAHATATAGPSAAPPGDPLLSVEHLSLKYGGAHGVAALTDVNLTVSSGEVVALIGETGSGKSSLVHSLLGLLPRDRTVSGELTVRTDDGQVRPLELSPAEARTFRRRQVSFIPQLTRRALVPVNKIEDHFREYATTSANWRAEALRRLTDVGLVNPSQVMSSYPHQLSGGMAQRVCIALAMMGGGQLVVADEPTSGLDALVKRRVADLLERTVAHEGSTMVLVTHDLYLARRLATRVAVMYGGFLVESGPSEEFFQRPQHPYSQALLGSMPEPGKPLSVLKGSAPRGTTTRSTCVFSERCPIRDPHCANSIPEMRELTPGHHVASWCVA